MLCLSLLSTDPEEAGEHRADVYKYAILFPFAFNHTENISQEEMESKMQFLSTLLL
jgi:hypothetical protein